MQWSDAPREEFIDKRLPVENIGNSIIRENLALGINVYHNAFPNSLNTIKELEDLLKENDGFFKWNNALVDKHEKKSNVRDCFDFKYDKKFFVSNDIRYRKAQNIYDEVKNAISLCMADYEKKWYTRMDYYHPFNFIKYNPGNYFKTHVDDSQYNSYTISIIVYLNDDYDGGELEWTRFGIKIKPKAGTIVIFPANFVYEHESHIIKSGTKYSIVAMTDYNDLNHGGKNAKSNS